MLSKLTNNSIKLEVGRLIYKYENLGEVIAMKNKATGFLLLVFCASSFAHSIELNAATFIPEWKKEIRIMLEEEAYFDQSGVKYLDGRQTQFHLIESE